MNTLRRRVAALACAALVASITPIGSSAVEAAGEHLATLPTDNPANFSPNVLDGEVLSIWQVGDRVVIGGTFTQVANTFAQGGTVYDRTGIASFDATTGLVDENFAPDLDGDVEVVVPAADGTSIYIGGSFRTVDGVYRRKLARLDVATGSLITQFDVNGLNGLVRDVRLVDDYLVVGGLFTSIGGQARAYLASVDATTGAVTDDIDSSVLGQHNGGLTKITKMDTTPDGTRLMVIGNFTSIDGQPRDQVAVLDLTQQPATVSPWHTDFFTSDCHPVFDTFLRDLDIAPTGDYAVLTTTGAYRADTSCDTIARLPIDVEVSDVEPDWVSYTGGDTSYAVEVHDGVAFVGGHMRWVNNPYAADRHGAGGVARDGMAALDVVTGLPYSWNPGRDRGVGLFDYHVTEQGIWAGSDTDRWNNELRMKLAFFPWAGGTSVEQSDIGDLPNDIFQLGSTSGSTGSVDPSVLYRVNAGGPQLASVDDGPSWEADTSSISAYRNSGSSTSTAPSSLTTPSNHPSVPNTDLDRPPTGLWVHERYDPSGGSEMNWTFPVASGTPVQVRLYLANRCRCTDGSGERIFDVDLDGTNVIDDLDLTNVYGHDVGAMRSFDIVSDGSVDILFRHGAVENPVVAGIEIVRLDVPAGGTFGEQDEVVQFGYDGVNPPTGVTATTGSAPWRHVRGAFMADSWLYTFHVDGSILRRTVDGATLSAGAAIDVWSNEIIGEMAGMTGVFYDPDTSKIYYTLAGQNSLFSRDFVAESATIGAERSTAPGSIAALAPGRVAGMFLGAGHLWFGDAATGDLLKMPYAGGQVSGTPQVADATIDWRSRALFRTTTAQPNIAPVAAAQATCDVNVCDFDGSGSTDSDGDIVSYAWTFGDGSTGEGVTTQHAYAAGGSYTASLTITDDRGGVSVADVAITVADPPNVVPTATITASCSALLCTFDGSSSADPDGTVVGYDWDFGDGQSASGASVQHTYGEAGSYLATLTVTDDDGATGSTTAAVDTLAPSASALFRSAASINVNDAAPTIVVPGDVHAGDQLVYILTVNSDATLSTPSGWTLLDTRQDGGPDMTSWVLTRTADGASAGTAVTVDLGSRTKAAGLMVAYQNAAAPSVVASEVMGATSFDLQAPPATVDYDGSAVISYWSDKSGGNTGWTTPSTVQQHAASVGSGSGRITAAIAGANVGAGEWPGAVATTTDDGRKGIAWTLVLPPANGNLAPTATFTSACTALSCTVDASASSDPDGSIASFEWDFGDATTATGASAAHDYAASGSYVVSLTVTDDEGATSTATETLDVNLAVVQFRASAEANLNTSSPSIQIPATVGDGDQVVVFVSTNSAVSASTPAGWTLLGTAEDGAPDLRSWVFTRTATSGDAGQMLDLSLSSAAKTSIVLVAYDDAAPITAATPFVANTSSPDLTSPEAEVSTAGSFALTYWVDKTSGNTGWTLPGSVTERVASLGSGGGRITAAAGDAAVPAGTWPGATASGSVNGGKAIAWTVIVPAP